MQHEELSVRRIHALDPALANQIAAGEVIERPSSVVKPWLEYSILAGSSDLLMRVDKGGSDLIDIMDHRR